MAYILCKGRTFFYTVVALLLGLASFTDASQAQTIRATGYIANENYQLNGTLFSNYPPAAGCPSDLRFVAEVTLHSSFSKHTFTAVLKRDGALVQQASEKFGPGFVSQNVVVTFAPTGFAPGAWTVEWAFQISAAQTGSASVALVAPIQASTQADKLYQYCNRNAPLTAVSYDNGICNYRPKPQTGFIYNNAYYRNATITSSVCPTGTPFGNGLCLIATAPTTGFVHDNALYFKPFGIPNYMHSPPYPGGTCPASLANQPVTKDLWGCRFMAAPNWQTPVAVNSLLALTEKKTGTCTEGTFDGAHCLIGPPPTGATAFLYNGRWYWTPRYCQ